MRELTKEQLIQLVKLEREYHITFFLFGILSTLTFQWIYSIIINL